MYEEELLLDRFFFFFFFFLPNLQGIFNNPDETMITMRRPMGGSG